MDAVRLRVEVLGPLRVRLPPGDDVTPDGVLQRRLLALLVLHRGSLVSVDAAADALWADRLPKDPAAAVQTHVFRIRRMLPSEVIRSVGDGYMLDAAAVDVDADELAAAVAAPPTDGRAIALLDAVLARWRGAAYPELADVDAGRAEAGRLEELRLRAVEMRAEAQLQRGAGVELDSVLQHLSALVDEHPLRERPRALLMTALAMSRRHVEALRVYDDFRRRLAEELGIEPSPALQAQHDDLLHGGGAAGWAAVDSLPVALNALIGRDDLVNDVLVLVAKQRLVTLLGPGGVGKTRVLIEVGHRLRERRPDRPVVLCELAAADCGTVPDVVAASLRIDGRPDVELGSRIAALVDGSEVVLLLDNCEHVVGPVAALVERLLGSCPLVTIVATSRERLRVTGEQLYPVPPLDCGGDVSPATQLFVERAAAVRPGFLPGRGDRERIGEIVRRLDGLPLAIELAASRLQTLDVAEVASGVDQRFRMLKGGVRAVARHASLEAAVSWSYQLLDEPLRRVFTELSVFSTPFTIDSAAAVCQLEIDDAADAVTQLVERSLLGRTADRRYAMLETLRAFAAGRLADNGLAVTVGARHADYFAEWVRRTRTRMLDDDSPALNDIDEALPELRVALASQLDRGAVEAAGRLLLPLEDYSWLRLRPDVLSWAARVIAADPDDASPVAEVMWAMSSLVAWMAGDVAEMGRRLDHGIQIAGRHGRSVAAPLAAASGSRALFEGRLADAVEWYARAGAAEPEDRGRQLLAAGEILLARAYAGDPRAAADAAALVADVADTRTPYSAWAWHSAGEVVLRSDPQLAQERFATAIEIAERTGTTFVIGVAGMSIASIESRSGDPYAAAENFKWLIDHWRRAGMWSTQWTMLRSIAALLARLGRTRESAVLAGAVQSTDAGHRLFGEDETMLAELTTRLRAELGVSDFEAATREGAALDSDTAVEWARRAL